MTQNHHVSLSISIDYCRKYQPEGDSEELYYSVMVDQLDLKKMSAEHPDFNELPDAGFGQPGFCG